MSDEKRDTHYHHDHPPPPPYGTFQGVVNHPPPTAIGFPQPVPPPGLSGAPQPPSSQYYAHGYQTVPGILFLHLYCIILYIFSDPDVEFYLYE